MTIGVLDAPSIVRKPEQTSAIIVEISPGVHSAIFWGAFLVVFVEATEHPARAIVGLDCC